MNILPHKREKGIFFLLVGLVLILSGSLLVPHTPTPVPEPAPTPKELREPRDFRIDSTHDAFEVPTGGKLGTLLVTVEAEQRDGTCYLDFSVWKRDNLTTPIQTMAAEGKFHWYGTAVDVNFDGYMDFIYCTELGNTNAYYDLWVWDEEQEQFCKKGGLYNPVFDEENRMISNYVHGSAASGVQYYWRWENGELVPLRRIETHWPELEGGTYTQLFTVEDRVNGELVEVYREIFGDPAASEAIFAEARLWEDLDYHGVTLWGFTINTIRDAFEVPTGGKLGTVLVTVEIGSEGEHQFSVWTQDDLDTPLQTMTAPGTTLATLYDVVDANFDGYMDFGYVRVASARALYYNYWLWNEKQGQFVLEPQLAELAEPQFDQTTKTIFSRTSWTLYYNNDAFFQWKGTELICIRKLTAWPDESRPFEFVVEALVDNELVEIHRETLTSPEARYWSLNDIDEKWYDLNYYGEEPETLWGFPIDEIHYALEVPTGGRLGTVLVTVEEEQGDDGCYLNFSVWKSDDLTTPIQTMGAESESRLFGSAEDINFDGYMDLVYLTTLGATNAYHSFWVWDEEQGQFCEKGGLFNPIFDAGTRIISSYVHYTAASGVQSYWRWENGELVALRRIELHDPELEGHTQLLTVEDRVDGELVEVYRKTFGDPSESGGIFDEALLWYDLDYHGE